MTANEYLKSIQDNFDGIEKNLDKLSKKEIDTMLNALAEGEDFPEEQPVEPITDNELYANVQRELMRQNKRTPYDMKDIIDATKMALKENQPVTGDLISRQAAIDAFQMFREYESNRTNAEWVKMIETVLNELPSIQPVTNIEKFAEWLESKDYLNKVELDFDWVEEPIKRTEMLSAYEVLKEYNEVECQLVTGKWMDKGSIDRDWENIHNYECTNCEMWSMNPYPYCPNCGAKMVDTQESEE